MSDSPKLPGRNTFKKQLAPGIWEDADGHRHFAMDEICRLFDVEPTEENMTIAARVVQEVLAEECPKAKTVWRRHGDE